MTAKHNSLLLRDSLHRSNSMRHREYLGCQLLLLLFVWPTSACSDAPSPQVIGPRPTEQVESAERVEPVVYSYEIVQTLPHDPEAYTQGLVYREGFLYEGTGPLNGRSGPGSSIRKVDLQSGRVLQIHHVEAPVFGEGIAIFSNRLIQLTWKAGRAFVYDLNTFNPLAQISYTTQGWGLTHDGEQLIMSDGTSTLYFRDPFTLEETRRVQVRAGERPVVNLNELEYIGGEVYANIWRTDYIARIDPHSGQVVAWIDLGGLLSAGNRRGRRAEVLNGIAYDARNDRLFVTGKWWPQLYEIKLVRKQTP